MENLGLKIKMLRESFDMTQETFGKHINVSRGHIAFIENGGKVTSVLLKKICKQFKLKEDDFNKNIDEFEYFLTDKEYVNKYDEEEMMKLILKQKNEIEVLQSEVFYLKENNSLLKENNSYLKQQNELLIKNQNK